MLSVNGFSSGSARVRSGSKWVMLSAALAGLLIACPGTDPVPTGKVQVTGKVLDAIGAPRADATVVIPGHAAVRTDATGTFRVADVATPYSALIAQDVDGGSLNDPQTTGVTAYDSLSVATPTLVFANSPFPEPLPRRRIEFQLGDCVAGLKILRINGSSTCSSANTAFSLTEQVRPKSLGANTQTFHFVKAFADGRFTHAEHTAEFSGGETGDLAPVDLSSAFQPIQGRSIQVSTPELAFIGLRVDPERPENSIFRHEFADDELTLNGSVVAPEVPGGTLMAEANSSSGNRGAYRFDIPFTQTNIELTLPKAVTSIAPADGSLNVNLFSQVFEIDNTPANHINAATFDVPEAQRGVVGLKSVVVVGNTSKFRMPNFKSLLGIQGTTPPSTGVVWTWGVEQIGGLKDVNEFATLSNGRGVRQGGSLLTPQASGTYSLTEFNSFTSQP